MRERVVVALGGQGGDHLVRRAARIAGRTGAHLVGVHVVSPGKTPGRDLERQRGLLVGLGGVYREIVGDNVAEALAAFARVEQATQLVIGAVPLKTGASGTSGRSDIRRAHRPDRLGRRAHRRRPTSSTSRSNRWPAVAHRRPGRRGCEGPRGCCASSGCRS